MPAHRPALQGQRAIAGRALTLLLITPLTSFVCRAQGTLFHNGNILTQDSLRPNATWFVVDDGRFLAVGGPGEDPPSSVQRVDLQGRTVMPGIIDAHIHFVDAALSSGRFDLGAVNDTATLRQRIMELARTSGDPVIVGRNLPPAVLEGLSSPRAWLDGCVPDRAVVLMLKSGHAAVAGSNALRMLGFGPSSRIKDGSLGRTTDGELDGWLYEAAAMRALEEAGARLTDRTLVPAILDQQQRALRYGITTIGDNTFAPYHLRIDQALEREGLLKLRVRARSYGRIPATHELMNGMGMRKMGFIGPRNDFDRVRYHAIKLFEDMSLSRPAGAHDHTGPGGKVFLPERKVLDEFLLHPRSTFAFHVQGKPGAENILQAWSQARPKVTPHRHVLDHAGYITTGQVERAADLGLAITVLAPQAYDLDRLLRDYAHSTPPIDTADLLNARPKVRLARAALTSDLPYGMDTVFAAYPRVDGLNPFGNMAALVEGRFPDGTPIAGMQGKTLTIDEALAAYTRNGAFALGDEEHAGRIASGTWADFIVLDSDPRTVAPNGLKDVQVLETYVAGEKVYDHAATNSTASTPLPHRIRPYDYNVSPVFGYDPTVGFIAGGAFFRYPLRTPGHYVDAQAMFSMQGQLSTQVNYQRFGLSKRSDGRVALGYTNMVQYYFGEGDSTKASGYDQVYADRINARPELIWKFGTKLRATLLADHRSRTEREVKDAEGTLITGRIAPDERSTAMAAELSWDTRDAVFSAHRGVFARAGLSYLPASFTNATGGNDLVQLNAELRAFRYLGSARWVLAARLRTGWSFGTSTYLFRYTLGGQDLLRGYYSNRFRGDDHLAGQLELRYAVTGRWTLVGFADAGAIGDGRLGRTLSSSGFGFRFAIKEQVVLRLDMGYGADQSGVFFTFGHTF